MLLKQTRNYIIKLTLTNNCHRVTSKQNASIIPAAERDPTRYFCMHRTCRSEIKGTRLVVQFLPVDIPGIESSRFEVQGATFLFPKPLKKLANDLSSSSSAIGLWSVHSVAGFPAFSSNNGLIPFRRVATRGPEPIPLCFSPWTDVTNVSYVRGRGQY